MGVIAWLLLALGLVLIMEGLAWALAPSFMERALALLATLSPETRRQVGLISTALGGCIVWIAAVLLG